MDGPIDGPMDGKTDGPTDELTDQQTDGLTKKWLLESRSTRLKTTRGKVVRERGGGNQLSGKKNSIFFLESKFSIKSHQKRKKCRRHSALESLVK